MTLSVLMTGLLIIDKPQGVTSHDVVRKVRRLLRTRRVGHCGTLDPLATGVLLVAVGEATRLVEFLMEGEKTYRATLKLGEVTDTQDSEGSVLERRRFGSLGAEEVTRAAQRFTGTIRQVPPMYSALKKDGVPLYRLARQGVEVERESREVEIRRLDVLEIHLPFVDLEVDCSKGTYIRTLCHDLGEMLGSGGHMSALRRTRSGSFGEADAICIEALERAAAEQSVPLIPLGEVLRGYPSVHVDSEALLRLRNGIPPEIRGVSGVLPEPGAVVALTCGPSLTAVARFDPLRRREKRGDFELLRVFAQELKP